MPNYAVNRAVVVERFRARWLEGGPLRVYVSAAIVGALKPPRVFEQQRATPRNRSATRDVRHDGRARKSVFSTGVLVRPDWSRSSVRCIG